MPLAEEFFWLERLASSQSSSLVDTIAFHDEEQRAYSALEADGLIRKTTGHQTAIDSPQYEITGAGCAEVDRLRREEPGIAAEADEFKQKLVARTSSAKSVERTDAAEGADMKSVNAPDVVLAPEVARELQVPSALVGSADQMVEKTRTVWRWPLSWPRLRKFRTFMIAIGTSTVAAVVALNEFADLAKKIQDLWPF